MGWDLDELFDIGAALEFFGSFPQRETLARVVKEHPTVAGPYHAPGKKWEEGRIETGIQLKCWRVWREKEKAKAAKKERTRGRLEVSSLRKDPV